MQGYLQHISSIYRFADSVMVKDNHACTAIGKDKDKEALFNVAYNVTDNISSRAILRHNNYIFNRYLPAFLYLPSTTPLYASISKGAASAIFYTFGMVRPQDSNPRPPAQVLWYTVIYMYLQHIIQVYTTIMHSYKLFGTQ